MKHLVYTKAACIATQGYNMSSQGIQQQHHKKNEKTLNFGRS